MRTTAAAAARVELDMVCTSVEQGRIPPDTSTVGIAEAVVVCLGTSAQRTDADKLRGLYIGAVTWHRVARGALVTTVLVLAVSAQIQIWSAPPAYDVGGRLTQRRPRRAVHRAAPVCATFAAHRPGRRTGRCSHRLHPGWPRRTAVVRPADRRVRRGLRPERQPPGVSGWWSSEPRSCLSTSRASSPATRSRTCCRDGSSSPASGGWARGSGSVARR